jgi:uncharacterized repeat protein (TIGR02543 family)
MNRLVERAQGAYRHSSSGWWRALLTSLLAAAVVLTGMGVLAAPASATVMLPGANAAAWPSAWKAYTLGDGTLIRDLNGDITPAALDIVSGTCGSAPCSGPESSVFFKSDGTNAFFRMRMGADNADATKGGLASGDYLVQIANSAGVVKAVVGVNGKTSDNDYVYVTDSIGGAVTEVYEFPFTSGNPSSAAMRWIPTNDGTGQYFLDFQVPLSAIQTISGGAITPTTAIRLNYGSSMAANLATINKDNMLGTSGSASPDFTDVKPVKFVPPVYAVTFDGTGGSAVDSQNVDDGEPAVEPAAPTRSGYFFDGWWTAASSGTQWSFTTPISSATSLYAHWTIGRTVSFDSDGGSAVASQVVRDGAVAVAPAAPSRAGYDFAGWFSGTDPFSFATPLAGDLALTAHWTKQVYAVSFDADGGTPVDSQSVAYQDLASTPAAPTRTGYDFQGWFLGGSAYDFATPVTGPVTLTAHWDKQVYAVSFDADGGTPVDGQSVAYQDLVSEPAAPTRAGHDFVGWFSGDDEYDFTAAVTGPLSLTAHWASQAFTVSFETDGGSEVGDRSVAYGDAVVAPSDPTRTGYDFAGWFSGGDEYDFTAAVTGPLSLTAHWTKQVYTVGFDTDGGTAVDDQPVSYGDSAVAPSDPTRTGHDFAGWFFGGAEYDFTAAVTGPLSLTAHWTKQVYTVGFDTDGGTAVDGQAVAYQDVASLPEAPSRTGYDFAGWFAGADAYDFATPVTGPLTLTAHWGTQVYPVSFDANGGTAVDDEPVAYGGLAIAPSEPTRIGYQFAGWFADGDQYDFATPVTGPLALTAHWTKQVYTVSFDANGGSSVASQPVAYHDPATRPANPARSGYVFQGWFADLTGGTAYDFAPGVEHDLVLHARWTVADHGDADTDGDGVTDAAELAGANAYHCATDPRLSDTDRDGLTDSQELKGIKMRVRVVTRKKTFRIGLVRTNPCQADTDRDGLKDGREVHGSKARHTHKRYKSNPLRKDTDRDHLSDKVEIKGSANAKHGHVGSNPLNWDTDHGGVSDAGEIRAGSDPTRPASGPMHPRMVFPGL